MPVDVSEYTAGQLRRMAVAYRAMQAGQHVQYMSDYCASAAAVCDAAADRLDRGLPAVEGPARRGRRRVR